MLRSTKFALCANVICRRIVCRVELGHVVLRPACPVLTWPVRPVVVYQLSGYLEN